MEGELNNGKLHEESNLYQIKLKGSLESRNLERFLGFSATLDDEGNTLLTGQVIDQAALHGLLKKVRDLGLLLVSVCPVQPGAADQSDAKS